MPPGFDKLAGRLRDRIELLTIDFARFDKNLKPSGRFSRAVFRRLFLDELLPARFERIVSVDSDMLIVRPGSSGSKASISADRPLAAAYDMIFYMDFKGDALARRFQRTRRSLGLALDTPYFNAGLMAIDRAEWRRRALAEQVARALRDTPERFPFNEQDALNATLKGDFAPLSPRFNFMGDFFLLDLERRIEPIVLHFVNAPKPWELKLWRGEARFARELPRLVLELALAGAGPGAAGAALAAEPAAAHPRAPGLRQAPVAVHRPDAVHRRTLTLRGT